MRVAFPLHVQHSQAHAYFNRMRALKHRTTPTPTSIQACNVPVSCPGNATCAKHAPFCKEANIHQGQAAWTGMSWTVLMGIEGSQQFPQGHPISDRCGHPIAGIGWKWDGLSWCAPDAGANISTITNLFLLRVPTQWPLSQSDLQRLPSVADGSRIH